MEETHVVLTSCGLELSCDPIRSVGELLLPTEAEACAQALRDDAAAGLVSLLHEVDGDPTPPFREDAILMLADGSLLLQTRHRDCGDLSFCEDGPWEAWGPHQQCSWSTETFFPDNIGECEDVPDWTCEDVAAALTQ